MSTGAAAAKEVIRIGFEILKRFEKSEDEILEKIGKDSHFEDEQFLLCKFLSLLDEGEKEEEEEEENLSVSPLSSSSSLSPPVVQEVDDDVVELSARQPEEIGQRCQDTESSMDMQEQEPVEQEPDNNLENFDSAPPPPPLPLEIEPEILSKESLEPQGQGSSIHDPVDDYEKSEKVKKMTHYHQQQQHHEASFPTKVCRVCGVELNSREMLMDHSNLHTGNRPYKCRQCRQRFAMRSELQRHRKSCHLDPVQNFRQRPNPFNRGMGHRGRSNFSVPPPRPLLPPSRLPPPPPRSNPQLFSAPLVSPPLQHQPGPFHRLSAPTTSRHEDVQLPPTQFQENTIPNNINVNSNCNNHDDDGKAGENYMSGVISTLRYFDGSLIHECRLCHQIFTVYKTALTHAKLHNNWSANNMC